MKKDKLAIQCFTATRRKLLSRGVRVGLLSVIGIPKLPFTLVGRGSTVLKLGIHPELANKPTLINYARQFAADVIARSNGALRIVYDTSLKETNVQKALRGGGFDMVLSAPFLNRSLPPAAMFFGAVPFGLNAEQKIAWMTSDEGSRLWSELYAPENIQPILFGACCSQGNKGQASRKEIKTLSDFKGLRVSAQTCRADWYRSLGSEVFSYPIITAMAAAYRQNRLDLTEVLPHTSVGRLNLHWHGPVYYMNDWFRSAATFELLTPMEKWRNLPDDLKNILKDSALRLTRQYAEVIASDDRRHLIQLRSQTTVCEFPDQVKDTFRGFADTYKAKLAATSPLARRIQLSYSSFNNSV